LLLEPKGVLRIDLAGFFSDEQLGRKLLWGEFVPMNDSLGSELKPQAGALEILRWRKRVGRGIEATLELPA